MDNPGRCVWLQRGEPTLIACVRPVCSYVHMGLFLCPCLHMEFTTQPTVCTFCQEGRLKDWTLQIPSLVLCAQA